MMTSAGALVDGSWELSVLVTDLQQERTLRVKGDLHIGGVMHKLVNALDVTADWSDHSLWWPARSLWLARTRSTLDQYGVQADARLAFTPMHKGVRLLLPDLQPLDTRVNFCASVFTVVIKLCKDLGIRHPEELSLARKLSREELKRNKGVSATRRAQLPGLAVPSGGTGLGAGAGANGWEQGGGLRTPGTALTPGSSPFNSLGSHSPHYSFNANSAFTPGSVHSLSLEGVQGGQRGASLVNSPPLAARDATLYRPHGFAEKARINAGWFDSSRSLMEQGVVENDTILLRFKFFSFYDLNPKYDAVRINQIYEQAKWALISEEIDCTEEQMMVFAALQLQIQQQALLPQPDLDLANQTEDDIDAALNDLEVTLEGSSVSSMGDITHTPQLQEYMRYIKPKRLSFKSYKEGYFVFKDTHLLMYPSAEYQSPTLDLNLKGCETSADVSVTTQKFLIKLFVQTQDGPTELWLRAESTDQYARWMGACRLAAQGRTMADSAYEGEVRGIGALLAMQGPAPPAPLTPLPPNSSVDITPENFIAPRFFNKLMGDKQLIQRVLEAHANVRDMRLVEAKLTFIKAWQALPEYGLTYFIVKLKGSKKEELLAVASNRLVRLELSAGRSLQTWRYQSMKTWAVNWESKQVQVVFEEGELALQCLTADCKVVHEFIGGYIFLSMRSGDKNQSLNEELFHKLTGGWL